MKQLFKGHPELTQGFAAFLPKEYKIDLEKDDDFEEQHPEVQMRQAQLQQQQQAQAQAQTAAAQQPRPPEVGEEHAKQYVKKIKARFVNQPHIYKSFLDILYTFSREKHGIPEVYAQVATLFADHHDLLAEFSHFLPDPNAQPTAQPAHGAFPAHHHDHDHQLGHKQAQQQQPRGGARTNARMGASEPASRTSSRAGPVQPMPVVSVPVQHVPTPANRGVSMGSSSRGALAQQQAQQPPPPALEPGNKERSHGTFDELMHFFKLKQLLPQNDYEEFLKLLSMYNADVLSKAELFFMVRDLLRHQDMELLDWFRKFMQVEDLKDDEPQGFLADFDWSASEKLGPSYRSMPRAWASWKCSGRQGNTLCHEVLNDTWISVPTGSEDGTFKNSRKTQYEELLFKCEDDRFEMDLLVESNSSAVRALELLLASFKNLSPSALATFQLNDSDLDALTIRAIRRVYTTRADEFLKMIMGKPAVAIPVVLARLKQKDTEWTVSRREWSVIWKQIFKKNYHKQLDHRSTTFKQEEKKMLTPKSLFQELRRVQPGDKLVGVPADKKDGDENTTLQTTTNKGSAMDVSEVKEINKNVTDPANSKPPIYTHLGAVGSPTLTFVITPQTLFADIKHLLLVTFSTQLPKADTDKFRTLWDTLVCSFFHSDPAAKTAAPPFEAGEESRNGNSMDVDIKEEEKSAPQAAATPAPPSNKPISTELDADHSSNHMLFLGNEAFYLLFRYLQIIYDRLNDAWSFSEEFPPIHHTPIIEIDPKQPLTEMPPPSSGALIAPENGGVGLKMEPGELDGENGKPEPQPLIYVEKKAPGDALTRYQTFLKYTEQLLHGAIDQSAFEENCRHEFGISCFPLFTIDKLLFLLAKQIHVVNGDETCEKLLGLYHYEQSRKTGGFTDTVYLSNCREVLGADKHACIFTYDWSSDSHILGITEVDLGHPSFGLEHNDELSQYINKLATNESVLARKAMRAAGIKGDYLGAGNGEQGDDLAASRDSSSPSVPFLRRNLQNADLEDSTGAPIIQNQLGVTVMPGSYKLRFVTGSEDVLQRPGRKTIHSQSTDKIELPALAENAALPSPMDS